MSAGIPTASPSGRLWSVVLAGGAGRRLASVTGSVPKQYWRPDAGASLLEQTLARVGGLTPPDRTVLVVDRAHAPYLLDTRLDGAAVVQLQPCDRGTAAGLQFGLLPVLDAGDDPVVIVTPADHGVMQDARFRSTVMDAAAAVQTGEPAIVLFGATPFEPCTDYGWIALGAAIGGGRAARFRRVAGFVEKPSLQDAQALHRDGAVWNTLVIVARAAALVDLVAQQAPALAALFDTAGQLRGADRQAWLAQQYSDLRPVDLSRDILSGARGLAATVWPASLGWTDLGTPERLLRWRAARDAGAPRLGRRPAARAAS
jgi:mannose-1-phosphate guanylyltransferase